jgi:hypothetical protein
MPEEVFQLKFTKRQAAILKSVMFTAGESCHLTDDLGSSVPNLQDEDFFFIKRIEKQLEEAIRFGEKSIWRDWSADKEECPQCEKNDWRQCSTLLVFQCNGCGFVRTLVYPGYKTYAEKPFFIEVDDGVFAWNPDFKCMIKWVGEVKRTEEEKVGTTATTKLVDIMVEG